MGNNNFCCNYRSIRHQWVFHHESSRFWVPTRHVRVDRVPPVPAPWYHPDKINRLCPPVLPLRNLRLYHCFVRVESLKFDFLFFFY